MKKILAILLLCGMVFSLCACPGAGPGTEDGPDDLPDTWLDEIDEYEAANGTEFNFGGDTLSISCRDDYEYEIYAKAASQEGIDPQIYQRNRWIQTRFNVQIQSIVTVCGGTSDQQTHYNEIADDMKTGKIDYDLISMWAYQSGKLVVDANYFDWRMNDGNGNYAVPFAGESIDTGVEYWPSKMNDPSAVLGHQYVAISDMCLTSYENAFAMVYNYDLVTNEGIATSLGYKDMYDIVKQGKWTMSLFNSIIKDYHRESVTGVQGPDATDTFGFLLNTATSIDAFIYSLGYNVLNNDGENMPQLWSVDSTMIATIEDLRDMCNSTGAYIGRDLTSNVATYDQFFTEGHALFASMPLEDLRTSVLHGMDDPGYGVLPYPKLTDEMEYITGSSDHYNVLSIPLVKFERLQIIGVVVEALSAETSRSVERTFLDKLIKTNSTRHLADEEMIDLIIEGRVYDLATYHHADLWIDSSNAARHLHAFFRVLVNDPDLEVSDYWALGNTILEGDAYTEGSVNHLIAKYINMFG